MSKEAKKEEKKVILTISMLGCLIVLISIIGIIYNILDKSV